MSDWRELVLGDSLELLIDNRGKNPPYVDGGVPTVSGQNVTQRGRLDLSAARMVSTETWKRWMPRPTRRGDIVMTSEAPLGRVARVGSDAPLALTQRVFGLRGADGALDTGFLYYALQTERVRAELEGRATGTTVVGIRQPALRAVRLSAPEFAEQKAIADVLGALDDKIAANTALATAAEALMHQTLRGLKGEQELPLSDAAEFVNGKAFTKGASGTGRIVIRIAELNSGPSGSTVYSDAIVDDKHVARAGDILFAWSGSLTLHRWFRGEAIVNQHIFKVIPRFGIPAWLVYELVRQKLGDFRAIAADKATTMGHIQRHHLDELVTLPSKSAIAEIEPQMEALWSISFNAERESLTLAATRDALLPQLMSGKLRVRDLEEML